MDRNIRTNVIPFPGWILGMEIMKHPHPSDAEVHGCWITKADVLGVQILGQCFLEPAKYFGQIYALVRPLEVKGASADGLFC